MNIRVGISNHHVHLTEEDYRLLFDEELTKRNDLTQPGEYASNQIVTIVGPKGKINNVRIIGPFRNYTQVEILQQDTYILGINPPVSDSGNLEDACEIEIIGKNKIIRKCCIISERHIHINEETRDKYQLFQDSYLIKINNDRGGILDNVKIKVGNNFNFELHIDRDEANAFLLKEDDEVELLKGVSL